MILAFQRTLYHLISQLGTSYVLCRSTVSIFSFLVFVKNTENPRNTPNCVTFCVVVFIKNTENPRKPRLKVHFLILSRAPWFVQKSLKSLKTHSCWWKLSNKLFGILFDNLERVMCSVEVPCHFFVESRVDLPQNFFLMFLDLELYLHSYSPPSAARYTARP